MSTLLQIRNVPQEVHRQIKVRSAQLGMSMSDYALQELLKALARPPQSEVLKRISNLPPLEPKKSAAALVREERERR